MTERDLQQAVQDLCVFLGARFFHPYDSRRSVAGWPDLSIVTKDGRFLLRELKVGKGRLSKAQTEWMRDLRRAGLNVDVWRDTDWPDRIQRELSAVAATRGVN